MFIIKYYLVAAAAFAALAWYLPWWLLQALCLWIGFSLLAVSVAYLFKAPGIFRKRANGSIPLYVRWLFIPFLLGAQFYNLWQRKRDEVPAIQEIQPGLYLACRLFPSDVHTLQAKGVQAILDVTAEFDGLDWTAESEELAYLNIPVLDHQSPPPGQLLQAIRWVEYQRRQSRGVVIHCALGRGRSVLVMAAYLLAKDRQRTVREVLEQIQQIRTTAALNRAQLRALENVHRDAVLDLRPTTWLIANPVAGGGKWQTYRREIEQILSPHYLLKTVETSESVNGTALAEKALQNGAINVIACGGDGTVTEVASALINTEATLGIIPLGTANALAHVLYGSSSKLLPVEVACSHIAEGTRRTIDTARCNERVMLLVAGIGFEQQMISAANREQKDMSGQFAYLNALWEAVRRNQQMALTVKLDEQAERPLNTGSLVIANAAPFTTVLAQGGGAPDIEDGLLDITWLAEDARPENHLVSMFELALSGLANQALADDVHYTRARRIRIRSQDTIEYVIDGEPYTDNEVLVTIVPRSLRVFCAPMEE
ncbi:dual specificity protein phosphatase family protein [Aestuariibacter halophilus]|uniref:Dual specificity protein phosphatase family protein n=1 Tax=Fluctibacter halophilus TaxID=226011 RepID=A0ABS8GAR0_9ALTE|nr:diacylglycerol kinase family protein [Aestuariibacter halophilus]MCC2617603.1 dual specificity protein phosphatase family protein [Aestuariibacter halophilus]